MKRFNLIYAALTLSLFVLAIAASITTPHVVLQKAAEAFKPLWWALPIQFGIIGLITGLEHVLPAADARKTAREYFLNFRILLFQYLLTPIWIGVNAAGLAALSKQIGLGYLDLRIGSPRPSQSSMNAGRFHRRTI